MLIDPTVLFGHAAFQLGAEYESRGIGRNFIEVRTPEDTEAQLPNADVLVVSKLWRNEWIDRAPRLKFIQSVSAGTEQYDRKRLAAKGIRLASAQGVNTEPVAEHAIGLMLSLTRQLHLARDRQHKHQWRTNVADVARREQELQMQTIAIVGLGPIGKRIADLARAFGMRVLGVNRSGQSSHPSLDTTVSISMMSEVLPYADFVILACPLTPETQGLINAVQLKAMKKSASLINVARGRVVDQSALIEALQDGTISSAGLDCFHDEPLPADSPLWDFDNVIITPHSAGETRSYEVRVIDILLDNLGRLAQGDTELRNQVI